MSLWLDILQHSANGEIEAAQTGLYFDLPLLLRRPETLPQGGCQYVGPVPKMVGIFSSSLSAEDRGMLRSREEDFIDYITDLIVATVKRTSALVEFCHQNLSLNLEEIAEQFNGWDGLKRGAEQKIEWVAKHIFSMNAAGISLPDMVTTSVAENGFSINEPYGYQELALVKNWQVERSWADFKRRQELDNTYLCLLDTDAPGEEETGATEEGFDYGGISVASVVLQLEAENSVLLTDLRMLGPQLTSELQSILENLHEGKPAFGYRPIAQHNVWWHLVSTYESIPLRLEMRAPLCEVDQTLADLLTKTYPEVLKPSRLNIFRRRSRLQEQCTARIHEALCEVSESFNTSISSKDTNNDNKGL